VAAVNAALGIHEPAAVPGPPRAHYRAYGLRLASSLPFPELLPDPDCATHVATDIEFEMGGDLALWEAGEVVMTWDEPAGTPWMTCSRTTLGYRFHYPGYADFLVDRNGQQVRCVAHAGTAPATIRHLFLDQVIPPLLNLRGREALHASAVQTPYGVCAFMGASGAGKSTLAGAFHALGYPVLGDDCLLLDARTDQLLAVPAYPGLRLWDDSRGTLFGHDRISLPVSEYTSKRRISTSDSAAEVDARVPLRRIYTLSRQNPDTSAAGPRIESISLRDAFMVLVEFSFRLDLHDHAMLLRQMRLLERVAREVPLKRLCLPADLSILPAVRDLVLDDLARS